MTTRIRFSLAALCAVMLLNLTAVAQTAARTKTASTSQAEEQTPALPVSANPTEAVANEIELLRKSLQTLNARLREISDKISAPDAKQSGPANDRQSRIAQTLNLLTLAEQRAEVMRRQLIEMVEKETGYRSRLVQLDEDMRPENIDRALSLVGTTRTYELREARRRILENERRGVEMLLSQTSQSRARLEDDVKQADALVSRMRQRVLPQIDKEIEKISPN